jgi:hypothetical protein
MREFCFKIRAGEGSRNMSRRILVRAARPLALLAFTAASATAAVRTARFDWIPATGPVAGYAVFTSLGGASEQLYGWVDGPSAVIEIESSVALSVRVAAFDATGALGPRSDTSGTLHLCPGDFDGDEVIGILDLFRLQNCFQQPAQGACAGGDVDLDGTVGLGDYGRMSLGAAACAPMSGCAGDFDRDGIIGLVDIGALRSCLGLLAQGRCAPADMNGDGFVGNGDLQVASAAFGQAACTR